VNELEKKAITQKFYTAVNSRDVSLMREIVTDDVVWSLPGKSLMSGEAHGVGAILERAEILDRFSVNIDVEYIVYGYTDVALHLHNTGKYANNVLDEHLTNVYVLRDDKICRIDTFVSDVDMLNAFFA